MQLIKCKIENFGKLSNVSLDFNDGLNSFVEENGWGKSTLAAFIKVMFFGFDGERTRDDVMNERKRYSPWQGGVYGGKLTFETKGKRYTITRVFGSKEKDDTFELRDADTNLVSEDFADNIGEMLFQIDRESFARTVFISQNNCKTETTDRINAKLGNLAEYTDDINNFESVKEVFKELLNKMSPTRKTGSIAQRKARIAEMEQEVRLGVAAVQASERLTVSKEEKKAEYTTLKNRQKELEEKQEIVQLQKDLQAKREKYQMLCESLETRRMELSHVQAHFPGAMPTEADLVTYGQMSQSLLQLKQSREHYTLLSEEEKMLALPSPKEEEIDRCWDIYPQIQELDKRIAAESAALQAAKATKKQEKNPKWIWLLLGAFLAIGGGICIAMDVTIAGVPLLVIGLVCVILGVAGGKKKEVKSLFAEQEQSLMILQKERDSFYQEMIGILTPYIKGEEISENRVLITLQELRRCAQNAKVLKEKAEKYEKVAQDYEEKKQKVLAYLESLSILPENDLVGQFANLREHLNNHSRTSQFYADAKTAKERFEETVDVSKLTENMTVATEDSLADMGVELRHISKRLEELHQDILSYNGQLELQREKKDEISEKEEELEMLRELQLQEQKKRDLIEKTKDLLEQAKTSFTQKYMAPIMNGFEKYYGILTGKPAENYQLDANTKLTVEECGTQHDTKFFSTGYQDLIGVCMRLALVDAMNQEEKPFIIMDDPFVNLDEEKTKGGLALLAEVAKEYQVVYFSCHRSRMKDEE